jgi:hypothetical protein
MFNNISAKIKVTAVLILTLGIFASFILFLEAITDEHDEGFLIAILVFISTLFASWLVFGFGELIENAEKTAESNERILQLLEIREQTFETNTEDKCDNQFEN